MLKIRTHLAGGILFLIFSIVILLIIPKEISTGFSDSSFAIGPRAFPYLVSIVMAVFSISLIFQSLVRKKDRVVEINIKNEFRVFLFFATIVVYVLLIKWIGFIFASLLMVGWALVFLKVKKWYFYLIVFLFVAVLYFSFTMLLGVRLP